MDLALRYNPDLKGLDVTIDSLTGDFTREDTLFTATVLSLFCDRTAEPHEVEPGADRRGWWADAYAAINGQAPGSDAFGSRLWLLAREKQTPETLQRLRAYIREALQWTVDDGLAQGLTVTVFAPQIHWYVAQIDLQLKGDSRRYRFEWNPDTQSWRLAGELQ